MSLEPPTYLSSLQNNIRARPIPWEGAVRAGSITDDHLKKIKAVDKVRKDQRRQTIEGDLQSYIGLLSGSSESKSVLDSASKRTDIVQYILVLAVDLINGVSLHNPTSVVCICLANCASCRCTSACFCPSQAPRTLQAFPSSPPSLYQCRRSHPVARVYVPDQPRIY